MCDLKRALDATGHCVLEMPSGTGKTVSLLSLIVSYQQFYPTKRKLIYCSRTVPEIEKALAELKRLMEYRVTMAETPEEKEKEKAFTGLGLTSRKNLCLNPEVSKEKKGRVVDARCRDLTNAAACQKGREDPGSVPLCEWHEELGKLEPGQLIPPGIWTLSDIQQYGREKTLCPYFIIRRMMPFVDVVIYSFHYLLDPKVAEQVSKELSKDAIVVFDEAHNIDNVCIESLSVDLTRPMLDSAARSVTRLGAKIEEIKRTDASKLQEEYAKLVEGLQEAAVPDEDAMMANPVLPDDLLNEAIPGNIRKAEHFVAFLKRFVEYLKTRMRVLHVVAETPLSFLQHLKDITFIEKRPLRFCAERLQSLVRTLSLTGLDEYYALQKIASFATLVATYDRGFLLILEPFETENATVPNPIFHFTCLDPSLAMKPVFEKFSSVVITSGTISPLDMYPKMLQFTPVVQETYPMTLTRNCFLPLGILNEVWNHKLIFVETPDANETSIALENYRRARLEYLRDAYRIRESEFLGFDAMRTAAQCVGRVLRGKTDWGLMVFADKRFARADKRAKLPRWINQYITETASNLSTDMAIVLAKLFMRTISQNPNENQTGISLWTLQDVEAAERKKKEEAAQPQMAEGEEVYDDGGFDDEMLVEMDLDL
ncbi:hypothetical protein Clacol_006607 [Clathrus columnatus]|uniref:DNA 5'-3' helicase n=1 Tax=Clathrus columnatus TaxID=1419009 RepID=A0AAV5AIR0_9AGAM|nr:hypothetical protein Clacol_006607 [Clathrus columnatus]